METSRRPKARPKNFGRKAAIESAIAKILGESGKTISDADRARIMGMMGESGKTISDADRQRAMDRAGMLEALEAAEMGMMSDADADRLRKQLGMKRGGKVKKMEDGGAAVPKKYKGFSKLPEKVQKKIDPSLAQKYEDGGAVRKKKGKSNKTGVCRGAGAAIRGTRFSGVR
tara:strand:+ start:419 stop:934 length:516 start_codon:yes stop_codon:yes gene_type:complete